MKIKWCTVTVSDIEKSKKFYGEAIGLKKENEFSPFTGTTIAFFSDDSGVEVELLCNGKATTAGNVSIGIESERYDAILSYARENECLVGEPITMPTGMTCFFMLDPDGTQVQIIKP